MLNSQKQNDKTIAISSISFYIKAQDFHQQLKITSNKYEPGLV